MFCLAREMYLFPKCLFLVHFFDCGRAIKSRQAMLAAQRHHDEPSHHHHHHKNSSGGMSTGVGVGGGSGAMSMSCSPAPDSSQDGVHDMDDEKLDVVGTSDGRDGPSPLHISDGKSTNSSLSSADETGTISSR